MKTIEELLIEFNSEPYTREEFETDYARLRILIAMKHGIETSEVDTLIAEHRYEHSYEDIEDEYIQVMAFGRHAGWV